MMITGKKIAEYILREENIKNFLIKKKSNWMQKVNYCDIHFHNENILFITNKEGSKVKDIAEGICGACSLLNYNHKDNISQKNIKDIKVKRKYSLIIACLLFLTMVTFPLPGVYNFLLYMIFLLSGLYSIFSEYKYVQLKEEEEIKAYSLSLKGVSKYFDKAFMFFSDYRNQEDMKKEIEKEINKQQNQVQAIYNNKFFLRSSNQLFIILILMIGTSIAIINY